MVGGSSRTDSLVSGHSGAPRRQLCLEAAPWETKRRFEGLLLEKQLRAPARGWEQRGALTEMD